MRESLTLVSLACTMVIVPLTAVHPDAGLLDATQPDLGAGLAWEQIHRIRPPALLSCRACHAAMSAKLSKLGMRFFAHRADASDCPTVGETIEHRLLKIELAAAIRDAGWHAELEVPGNGWRADVLATSPDASRRIAFEAQLAAVTVQDLAERTASMAADGVKTLEPTSMGGPPVRGGCPTIPMRRGRCPCTMPRSSFRQASRSGVGLNGAGGTESRLHASTSPTS